MTPLRAIARRKYISFPAAPRRPGTVCRALRQFTGLVLLPVALVRASRRGTPGLQVRLRCIVLGLRCLASGDLRRAFSLVANPMDSFRYFELDFVSHFAGRTEPVRYLDVSSPRLVVMLLLERHRRLTADVLNPLEVDLRETTALADTLHLADRCRMKQCLIEDADYPEESFDLITSISVVEHIPNDSSAVAKMWRLLKPGGTLLITVPCAKEACEEFANLDEYELLARDPLGFVYWQRYYDRAALAERLWSITGPPTHASVFGEVAPGSYDDNVMQKRTNPEYPYWWEPVMMGRDYRSFEDIDRLPGMGVIAMKFVKPRNQKHV